jgi:thiamine biosynthesis lipoprotein
MACEAGIAIRGEDETFARRAADAAFEVAVTLEADLSRFRPDGDVARIAALRPGRWLVVSPWTAACLRIALRAMRHTAGAFDPGFRSPAVARAPRGLRRLVVDPVRPRVRVTAPVALDLGAVGKGYAADRMAEVLREWGVREALIHLGGSSVRALGAWEVALRHPRDPARSVGRIPLRDAALGASGQYLNGPHVVEPRTGAPARRTGAWVVADSAALADALSTACLLLPVTVLRRLPRRAPGLSVMIAAGEGRTVSIRRFGSGRADDPAGKGAGR